MVQRQCKFNSKLIREELRYKSTLNKLKYSIEISKYRPNTLLWLMTLALVGA